MSGRLMVEVEEVFGAGASMTRWEIVNGVVAEIMRGRAQAGRGV